MLGALIGDIAGSRFEHGTQKSKEFALLHYNCDPTDDSVMTLAVGKAILQADHDLDQLKMQTIRWMQKLGREYPEAGYGGSFYRWIYSDRPEPYGSWGNGSAMRVSPCGFAAETLEEAEAMAKVTAEVSHSHPEGIQGAQAIAAAVFLARTGASKEEIGDYIAGRYYPLNFTLDEIRESYSFDVSCRGSVPQALEAFLESEHFEDAIRNAISLGGDSDTLAAMAGGVAEAFYGIPEELRRRALTYLDDRQLDLLLEFESVYPPYIEK